MKLDEWVAYDISWSKEGGLAIYMNNKIIQRQLEFTLRSTIVKLKTTKSIMYFGKTVFGKTFAKYAIETITFSDQIKEILDRIPKIKGGMCS